MKKIRRRFKKTGNPLQRLGVLTKRVGGHSLRTDADSPRTKADAFLAFDRALEAIEYPPMAFGGGQGLSSDRVSVNSWLVLEGSNGADVARRRFGCFRV